VYDTTTLGQSLMLCLWEQKI